MIHPLLDRDREVGFALRLTWEAPAGPFELIASAFLVGVALFSAPRVSTCVGGLGDSDTEV